MIYCFDLDGTLCSNTNGEYEKAIPCLDRIQQVNFLFDSGNTIKIDTARGSTTKKDWSELTENQLKTWGLKYHELRIGTKLQADKFIDDKGENSEDFFAPKIFHIVSYPRSGLHFFCYILEQVFRIKTYNYGETEGVIPIYNSTLSGVKSQAVSFHVINKTTKDILCNKDIRKSYYANIRHDEFVKPRDSNKIPMFLLVRNYKECLIRNLFNLPNKYFNEFFDEQLRIRSASLLLPKLSGNLDDFGNNDTNNSTFNCDYIRNIKIYDNYKFDKQYFYYCDLIKDPNILDTLSDFLKKYITIDEGKAEWFKRNFSEEQKKSKELYNQFEPTPKTEKNKLFGSTSEGEIYHSAKHLDKHQRIFLDNFVKEKHPLIFEKYLQQYDENKCQIKKY